MGHFLAEEVGTEGQPNLTVLRPSQMLCLLHPDGD